MPTTTELIVYGVILVIGFAGIALFTYEDYLRKKVYKKG